jgi:hypothetical protein
MRKIEKGKYYFLKVNYEGRVLDYEGEIVFLDENEFGIKTEEDCDLRFSLRDLFFVEERDKPEKDNTIVVRRRVGSEGLREVEGPKGL